MNKSRNQAQPSTNDQEYFNLHGSGCGYLSRVRWVTPKRGRTGDRFLACAINALRGSIESPDYTYFDLRVSGEDAIEVVAECMPHVEAGRKVFVAFKIGDYYPHWYEREVKDDKGRTIMVGDGNGKSVPKVEPATLIKGRLLLVSHVKVDGETVYTRDADGLPPEEARADRQETGDPRDDDHDGQRDDGAPEAPQEPARQGRDSFRGNARPQMAQPQRDRSRVRSYA